MDSLTDNDFYQEELLDAYKNPQNRGQLEKPSVEVSEKNPMCGDEITLQLEIKDGVIKAAKFHGSACVVSVVSSEFLIEHLIGKSVKEAAKITKEDILELLSLNLTTSRVKCATLALTALKRALAQYEKQKGK
jgi:nitrogen fixation NifU-like protein